MSIEWRKLPKTEVAERSQLLAQKVEERLDLQSERKLVNQEFKKQFDALDKEIINLSVVVRTGEERQESKLFDD